MKTGICLSLLQEQPEVLRRVATLCVYANMLGCAYIAQALLVRALSGTNEMREKLYAACETPTRAWRVEEGLSQWAVALNTDIQSWMYAHSLPAFTSRNLTLGEDHIAPAINAAYDGNWNALRTLIEQHTSIMPPGVTALQFMVENTGLTVWQERGLERMIKDKTLALQINADAQLWQMKGGTTTALWGNFKCHCQSLK